MKYIKVGKCKLQEYYVTKLISEQFSKSWLDDLSRANLNKCVLQKVEISVLKFGIGPSYFWSLSQVWFQNSFQNHDPTICFLRKKENIFYRKWLFCYISLALPWTPGTPLMSLLTALDPLDFPRPLGHPLIISKWSVRTSSGVGGVSWQNIHVVTVYLCQRGPCQTPSWGTGEADE